MKDFSKLFLVVVLGFMLITGALSFPVNASPNAFPTPPANVVPSSRSAETPIFARTTITTNTTTGKYSMGSINTLYTQYVISSTTNTATVKPIYSLTGKDWDKTETTMLAAGVASGTKISGAFPNSFSWIAFEITLSNSTAIEVELSGYTRQY